jgi:hypothetical protein
MSLLCDYFMAPSDLEAGATIGWVGGPTMPPDGEVGYASVAMNGVDPVVMMGTLDELLTGRAFEEVLADTSGYQVAVRDEGEGLVWHLSTSLRDGLAGADEDRLRTIATQWVQTEEFGGLTPAEQAATALVLLASLVRTGQEQDHHLYCWLCL